MYRGGMSMNINAEVFGKNLVYLRTKYALPQKAVARLTGISLPILRMTERGEVIPRLTEDNLSRLCGVFNVTPGELLQQELS